MLGTNVKWYNFVVGRNRRRTQTIIAHASGTCQQELGVTFCVAAAVLASILCINLTQQNLRTVNLKINKQAHTVCVWPAAVRCLPRKPRRSRTQLTLKTEMIMTVKKLPDTARRHS